MEYLGYLIRLIIGVAIFILGLRFVLIFFIANPFNPFVEFIYSTSSNIMLPFRGIFPTKIYDGYIVEYSTLFAILIYAILAYFIGIIFNSFSKNEKKVEKIYIEKNNNKK